MHRTFRWMLLLVLIGLTPVVGWTFYRETSPGLEMSDAATVNGEGNRTVQSMICKTTMTTQDSVERVVAFYHDKLTPGERTDDREKAERKEGRSVVFSDDSEGRPFALHTILINTPKTSTTLIITRGKDEPATHITWKHYVVL